MSTMTTDRMGMMGMGMMPAMMPGMMPGMMGGMMGGMMPGMMGSSSGMMAGMPGMSGMMIPRCTMKMEKMAGGMKVTCMCDDKVAAAMMQNLCMMNANGMMSCCMMMNGMPCCMCNMSMGKCTVDMMEMGCVMTCTSGDPMAMKMIEACCTCMMSMMMPGCTCYMMMNGMPVCCCMC